MLMKPAQRVARFLRKAGMDSRLHPSHISLFMVIVYFSTEGPEGVFRVSRKKLMAYSRISSIVTYHKCMKELHDYGYVLYKPSFDPCRGSAVSFPRG